MLPCIESTVLGIMLGQVRVADSLQLAGTRSFDRHAFLMIRAYSTRVVGFGRGGTVHGAGAVITEHTLQRILVNKGILQAVQT